MERVVHRSATHLKKKDAPAYNYFRPFWLHGSTDSFTEQGVECPSTGFAGGTTGGYMLANSASVGLEALLESPPLQSDKKTCMMFDFNVAVNDKQKIDKEGNMPGVGRKGKGQGEDGQTISQYLFIYLNIHLSICTLTNILY